MPVTVIEYQKKYCFPMPFNNCTTRAQHGGKSEAKMETSRCGSGIGVGEVVAGGMHPPC